MRRSSALGHQRPITARRSPRRAIAIALGAHRRKENHVADRGLVGQQHDQPVDADPHAAGRRHAVLERADIVGVELMRLLVTRLALAALILEPGPLIVGIVQLAERIGELGAVDEQLEALGEARIVTVRLGERRQRLGIVEHEGRLDQRRFERVLEDFVEQAAAGQLRVPGRPARPCCARKACISASDAVRTSMPHAARIPSTNVTRRYGAREVEQRPAALMLVPRPGTPRPSRSPAPRPSRASRGSRRRPGTTRAS